MKSLSPRRSALLVLAFLIPPCIVGPFLMLSTVKDVMVHRPPSGVIVPTKESLGFKPLSNDRPLVLITMGAHGTQTFELLAAAEIFAGQSLIVGPRVSWLPTTGAVSVLPDISYREVSAVDVLVIPSMVGAKDPELLNFVREWAPRASLVLTIAEGQEVVKLAEITHTRILHAPPLKKAISTLERLKSRTQSFESLRSIRVEELSSPSQEGAPFPQITALEQTRLFLNAGFDWTNRRVGLWLDHKVSELKLATWLDAVPRTLSSRAFTFNEERTPVRLKNGVVVLPTHKLRKAPFPDRLIWLGSVPTPSEGSDLHRFLTGLPLTPVDLTQASVEAVEKKSLEVIQELEDSAMASVVARLTQSQIRIEAQDPILPFSIWYRVPLLGFLGAFFFWMWNSRLRKPDATEVSK